MAMQGKVGYMPDLMGVYRREIAGSWSSAWNFKAHKSLVMSGNKMYLAMDRDTNGRYRWLIWLAFLQSNIHLYKAWVIQLLVPGYHYFQKTILRRHKNGGLDVRKAIP
jgi:hypothetical protein